ncbi:D-aminopeptidase [Bacillus sp. JCM 19046]|nr:D-aminopeptidase [Bacillus sp. JCM 19046]
MSCLGYKGGIGTSSRSIGSYTVGCLVLTNYGKKEDWQYSRHGNRLQLQPPSQSQALPDGSIIIVLATDAPLDARQLKRLSKRGALGLGRTGSYAANGSGDIVLSFSTAFKVPHVFPRHLMTYHFLHDSDPQLNQLFAASADAVEEAILNALCAAGPMTGFNGHQRTSFTDALRK